MTCNSQSDDFVQAKSNSATLKIVYVGWEPWPSGYGWRLKVVGSNPGAVYWMDIFHIDLLKKLFEKTENKRKEAGFGPFKNNCLWHPLNISTQQQIKQSSKLGHMTSVYLLTKCN